MKEPTLTLTRTGDGYSAVLPPDLDAVVTVEMATYKEVAHLKVTTADAAFLIFPCYVFWRLGNVSKESLTSAFCADGILELLDCHVVVLQHLFKGTMFERGLCNTIAQLLQLPEIHFSPVECGPHICHLFQHLIDENT